MSDYLGIEVPDDGVGVLQDAHLGGGIVRLLPDTRSAT